MPNESLEVVWNSLLGLVVPNLEKVVLASGQHEASVVSKVGAGDGSFVHCVKLAKVRSVEDGQTVDPYLLVLGNDDQLAIVPRELEAAYYLPDIDLMPEHH